MLQIRKGVFETNSSSSHSIVVTKEPKNVGVVHNSWHVHSDGEMSFYDFDLSFGRSFDILADWYGRLRYYIAEFIEGEGEELDRLTEICRKHIDGFDHFEFPIYTWDDTVDYGNIDHQSAGLLRHVLSDQNISPEDFIFNDRYIVIVDGDEYNIFDTFQRTPMYNPDNVQEVYG